LGAVHLLVVWLFDLAPAFPMVDEEVDPRVQFLGSTGIASRDGLEEQISFRDSKPLFMPTRWNAASDMTILGRLQDAAEAFQPYSPDLLLPKEPMPSISKVLPELRPENFIPTSPSFFLSRYERQPLASNISGRSGQPLVVIRCMDCLDSVEYRQSLAEVDASLAPTGPWQPLVGYFHIVEGRVAGRPMLGMRSGYPDWDSYLWGRIRTAGIGRRILSDQHQSVNEGLVPAKYFRIWRKIT
jgi:hypothetical protein